MDDLHGGAKTCVTTGNASLSLCNIDEKGDTPVNTAPLSAEAQKRADKDAEEKSKPDYSSFDIVKAAQYGALERVVELVDEKGYDVNKRDDENVTLLHWSAINNRQEIAKFLIDRGAVIDAIGGELISTPIHWATRQGHLPMIVLLLKHGADPTYKDGEGCNCLHLAAQLGHTAIAAYFVAKGCDVNGPDANGMSPLMWACFRSTSGVDPARLLIRVGASATATDSTHGNTPLHWAIVGKNHHAISVLSEKPNVDFHAVNLNGETPISMFQSQIQTISDQNKQKQKEAEANGKPNPPLQQFFVPRKIRERFDDEFAKIAKNGSNSSSRHLRSTQKAASFALNNFAAKAVSNFFKDKKVKLISMVSTPFVLYWACGLILHVELPYLAKFGLFVMVYIYSSLMREFVFDDRVFNILPLSIYFAMKWWFYITWIVYIVPFVSGFTTTTFLGLSVVLWYNFLKAWKGDPGIVVATADVQMRTIVQLAEKGAEKGTSGCFDSRVFCSTCLIRKPVRSKHCSICDRCIARFDHHCPWIGNCVGALNHKYFMGYLYCVSILMSFIVCGVYVTLRDGCSAEMQSSVDVGDYFGSVRDACMCNPWVAFAGANAGFHFCWVFTLAICQTYQISCLAMTTNERMNAGRYTHFHKRDSSASHGHSHGLGGTHIESPFDKGWLQNIVDFAEWRCSGFLKPNRQNWTSTYDVERKEFDDHDKVPLLGSSNGIV